MSAFTVSGTCSENSANVVISVNGVVGAVTACTSNAWSIALDVQVAADGNVVIWGDHSSLGGVSAQRATQTFQKETAARSISISASGSYTGGGGPDTFNVTTYASGMVVTADGKAGSDTMFLPFPHDWARFSAVANSVVTVTENHASGARFTLTNIETLRFSDSFYYRVDSGSLTPITVTPTPTPTPNPTPTPAPGATPVQATPTPIPASSPWVIDPANTLNTMTIKDKSGSVQTNYPMQIGRPFKVGEIANYPKVLVDGVAVTTQADVKTRYPDGSVKHAILSFIIPSIPANGTVTLTFQNQLTSNNTAATKAEMLDGAYDFDAVMELTQSAQSRSVSARQMLQDNAFTYWTSGPIATTVILADHSATRSYDMGFDGYRSIRPIIHATFWPSLHKVRVRFIAENSNTTTLEDVQYGVALKMGFATPQQVYSKASVTHFIGSRWTKEFWINGAPETRVNVDHNLKYLRDTKSLPNYDTNLSLSESLISGKYAGWLATNRDLYQSGSWTQYMPTTGARADIGPLPFWTMYWLYTGDYRMKEWAFGQADLASAWGLNWREGSTTLKFDRAQTIPALGKPMSINARPTLWFPDNNGSYGALLVNSTRLTSSNSSENGWSVDLAHQADPFSAQYLLSGDYFYLEQAQLWAAGSAMRITNGLYGRGANGYAGIQEQVRGCAWTIRNRVNAAFLSPDGTIEKQYFQEIVNDAIAMWEGARGLTGTAFSTHPNYTWAYNNLRYTRGPIPFFNNGINSRDASIQTADVGGTEALWQNYYLMGELARAQEKGFAVSSLVTWHAPLLAGQVAAGGSGYELTLIGGYYTPVKRTDGTFYGSWLEIQAGFLPSYVASAPSSFTGSNYGMLASAAAAAYYHEPGMAAAWEWLRVNGRAHYDLTGAEISFNIVPRPDNTPLP